MQCAMHVKPEVRFNWSYLKLVKQQGQAGRAQGWLLLDWLPIKVMAMKICNGLLWYAIYICIVFGGARWRQCASGGCPNRFASSSELSEFLHHIVTQFPIKMQRAVSSSGHRHLEFCEVPAVPTADIENKPEAATTELPLEVKLGVGPEVELGRVVAQITRTLGSAESWLQASRLAICINKTWSLSRVLASSLPAAVAAAAAVGQFVIPVPGLGLGCP